MMQKQLITITIISMFICLLFCGCNEEVESVSADERFVGVWNGGGYPERIIIFYPDGTWSSTSSDGTWTLRDDKLFINKKNEYTYIFDYYFVNEYTLRLTQSNGLEITYRKPSEHVNN